MFEKKMDEQQRLIRGQGIFIGLGVFSGLLIVKDALVDFQVIRIPKIGTIVDVLFLVLGIFIATGFMIQKRVLSLDYLGRTGKILGALTLVSVLQLLPTIISQRPLIDSNQVTLGMVQLSQVVLFTAFTIFLWAHWIFLSKGKEL
ncbi:hypothetical protein [Enterococcus asini]|uniref:hypothetical protein n=1 Tax=Enterococcus asini TaxID=57732 RepID=UPI00241D7B6C|nr:hypothetical protein [Enterococcus asini]